MARTPETNQQQHPQHPQHQHQHQHQHQQSPTEQASTATATSSDHDDAAASSAAGPAGSAGSARSASTFAPGLSIDSDDADIFSDYMDNQSLRSTCSASSSVYEFVQEFGRTYHRYKEGKYLLPNDEQEQKRLDLQHHIALRLLGGKLNLAPIEHVHRVLDMGTGTGIWAVEFAEQHPEADVFGTDLSPIQPPFVPPNLRFEVDDIDDPWVYSQPFDYIHGRYILPSLKDPQAMLAHVYDNLRPGGFVEIMETLMKIEAVDDSLQHTVLPRWHQLLLDGIKRMGRADPMVPLRLKQMVSDAGFINVVEKKFAVPANTWARGDEQKMRGAMMLVNLLEAAEGITMAICTKVWGWSQEAVEEFLEQVRADLNNKAHHGYITIICVYAQKPEA